MSHSAGGSAGEELKRQLLEHYTGLNLLQALILSFWSLTVTVKTSGDANGNYFDATKAITSYIRRDCFACFYFLIEESNYVLYEVKW